ncbi:tautomerase family protein [Stenotrophobium rhamnosiphilum]|uniref:Tautomerase n=1 Tax=Stenotrophobium rhamnosiphilum TaxID=2029166 RepID=A0A2T5MCA8_9GAMM|nr:tautomerase [Stenotrophobium rhamnosiphilum]PTU30209.1 tautomerase [Stenotrophobium rhamnosiphilum]
MPNIFVRVPKGAFPADARQRLVRNINDAAGAAEQIPNDPQKRFLTWVVVEEIESGMWTCGGLDVTAKALPCFAIVHVPAGVLNASARALYIKLMYEAFQQALPEGEQRQLLTSVILQDVADGDWGGNGIVWTLPKLAQAAGYAHLQHLTRASAAPAKNFESVP